MQEQQQRWKDRLSSLTELILPTDYPRIIPLKIVDAECIREVTQETSMAILKLSTITPESSPFCILLAAFACLLHRYTGEEDIIIGSASQSSNPLVLRLPISTSDSLQNVIKTVVDREKEALEDEIPFEQLVNALSVNGETMQSLFKVRFFNVQDTTEETLASSQSTSQCDLTVFISQTATLRRILPIQIKVVYNSCLFGERRITHLLDQLELLLCNSGTSPSTAIGELSLLTKDSKTILPDPTADLKWSQYEGSITDIFAKNAAAHPQRVCIQEEGISYNYQQINEASNILAHYLTKNGIKREDVVVLYSYRGADLVVAVMGVLKSGATFSVIDPAYPPARQNIYLQVSKPKGLVILEKAGSLLDEVREYVNTNLDIVCEVPALAISADGTLKGGLGASDGQDIFDSMQSLKKTNLDIVLGPDSIGTLSFTSGSTGIPKGVKGRHHSLTHFFPWMMEEFGLSSNDRFTMLSGIAHDPIQRDIFTPLFMGARICIPTSEDIGIPGKLAEWMAKQEITVTHLTPAMGQLLSANAVQPMPTLKNAFFVGDVLTKRDVIRLQHLANNARVINMYGTTETQRAVSYLSIPAVSLNPGFLSEQKDIMAAGRGMKNVQLLILNKKGLMAGVGELGEIYVRSGGLAEGYLGLPEATNEKFVLNPFAKSEVFLRPEIPFYLGDRDRMYRTGDLGRYMPDGNVECTGRADDQVKIRGFRIELKEIDTHLSQHGEIRENVTLVRRDKYEEKTLVCYFVPLAKKVEDPIQLIKSIRDYLKQKLPSYAIPSVFVPLTKMPLTPNGKIDKNALPFPDTALAAAAAPKVIDDSNFTPLQVSLRDLWAKLLEKPINSISLEDNFFDLGGHSILATQLVFEIRQITALEVPLGLIYKSPVLGLLAADIDFFRGGDLNLTRSSATAEGEIGAAASPMKLDEPSLKFEYHLDVDIVDNEIISASGLPTADYKKIFKSERNPCFFITGVTGFLGAFIISAVFKKFPNSKIYCLVRAKNEQLALDRVIQNLKRHLLWNSQWKPLLVGICGDLAEEKFGMDSHIWDKLCIEVDAIIHNGALVHWVYPYQKLRAPNVLGTKTALIMASTGHLKPINFVSSTSVLDTEYYTNKLVLGKSVYENDDLKGSQVGLNTGYGQTKWVAEQLVLLARSRGVPATIVRPGYIVGDSMRGVTNTDDFIWRLIKGCVQLGQAPRISNIVNMCSVDYVANCVVEVVSSPKSVELGVFHTWNAHHFKFDDLFANLVQYYEIETVEYIHWRTALMDLTLKTADHALFPLLHFVIDDLPTSTKNPELDDSNMRAVIKNTTVTCANMKDLIPLYLGYLCHVNFLQEPKKELPIREEWSTISGELVTRSGA